MRISNALRHIEHIASLSLAPHIAIPEMLRTVHGIVPEAQSGFFWVGAHGEVLDAYAPAAGDLAPGCARSDRVGYPALRFEDECGFHVTVSTDGRRRAVLMMRRVSRATPFTERERRILVALAPCFGRALAAPPGQRTDLDDVADRIGVVVASGDGRLVSADAHARQLLIEMLDQPLTAAALSAVEQDLLPPFLADFVRHQRRAPATAPTSLQRASRWGVYRARAFPQLQTADEAAPQTHAILLSRHLPRTIRIMRAVERFDLSPRERQAAFQLGVGADAASGAMALGVSVATWRSYVKRVYQRLDVNDRIGLMQRLQQATTL